MVACLACLIVVTQYFGGTADLGCTGLHEAYADVVLQVLKLATDLNYTNFLKCKLDWCQEALKSDWHAPSQEERGEEVDGMGIGGGGVQAGGARAVSKMPDMN